MKNTSFAAALSVAATMLVVVPAGAQELALGTWSGTMTPPGAGPVPVAYEVSRSDSGLAIVMTSLQVEGEMPFQDVAYDGQVLVFWWDPGIRVDCALRWNSEGSLQGTCSDGSQSDADGAMLMTPPDGVGPPAP